MTIYAKTGTGQTFSRKTDERESDDQALCHAWCVAHFQHLDEEPLVLVIILEYVGSSRKATKVAQQFFKKYKQIVRKKEASK